ncbi:MAG: manganese efflux pump [Bacteroidales bacterium]|nr:manganese efflux pump [Bacteroidales bacterium]
MISIGFLSEAVLLGLALAMDCFTVSIVCGLQKTVKLKRALLIAFCFGLFQGLMPIIGGALAGVFKSSVESVGHWIAFTLLFIIGLKMIMDGRSFSIKTKTFDVSSLKVILLLSIATSIDAFITGMGMSMQYNVGRQLLSGFIIGLITFIMSLIGWKSGEKVNFIKPRFALVTGGLILIAIGVKNVIAYYLQLM